MIIAEEHPDDRKRILAMITKLEEAHSAAIKRAIDAKVEADNIKEEIDRLCTDLEKLK